VLMASSSSSRCLRPGGGQLWSRSCRRVWSCSCPARYIPRTRHRTGAPERFWDPPLRCDRDRAVLVITLAVVGNGWYPGNLGPAPGVPQRRQPGHRAALPHAVCPRHRCRGGSSSPSARARHRPAELTEQTLDQCSSSAGAARTSREDAARIASRDAGAPPGRLANVRPGSVRGPERGVFAHRDLRGPGAPPSTRRGDVDRTPLRGAGDRNRSVHPCRRRSARIRRAVAAFRHLVASCILQSSGSP